MISVDERLVAEAIAERLLAVPEYRVELIKAQGGGRYLTIYEVAKKLKKGVKAVKAMGLREYQLPGEKGLRFFEPEVEAWMDTRCVGGVES